MNKLLALLIKIWNQINDALSIAISYRWMVTYKFSYIQEYKYNFGNVLKYSNEWINT